MADEHKDDDVIKFALLIGVFILFLVLMWIYFKVQILSGIRWIRVGEIYLIRIFTDNLNLIQQQLITLEPQQLHWGHITETTKYTSVLIRYPLAVVLAIMGISRIFITGESKYMRRMGIEQMIHEHAKGFPVVAPITKLNPLETEARQLGTAVPSYMQPFAEALAPEEWVAYNAVPMPDGKIDPIHARIAFAKQLGPRWRSPDHLPLHQQVLLAAFSMKANDMRKESDEFLSEVSKYWHPQKGLKLPGRLVSKVKKVLRDPRLGMVTAKLCKQHAFVNTALLRALKIARQQGGVLSPSQFLWLRAEDRTLWYPLNNLGREASHAEASGAMAHFRAELMANKPIPNPQMGGAVEGLVEYLKETGVPIPARDYGKDGSGGKKKKKKRK